MNKFYFAFLLLIFLGLGLYYVISAGWYPIAIVNGRWIMARQFNREYKAVVGQYRALTNESRKEAFRELERATLDNVISNALIYEELKRRLGNKLPALIEAKIRASVPDKGKLAEAVNQLYGLKFSDFQELILIPQARRDVLAEQLSGENRKLEDWFLEKRSSATVLLFSGEFGWGPEGVLIKKLRRG